MEEENNNNSPVKENINDGNIAEDSKFVATPKSVEEDVALKAASQNLDEGMDNDIPMHKPVVGMLPKKSHKKLYISLFIVILLTAVGYGLWTFVLNKKEPVKTDTNTVKTEENKVITNSYEPENIAYAYRAADSDPFSVFYRPAIGGERKEVTKLDKGNVVLDQHTVGSVVAFLADNKIYLSSDSGKTYSKIYEKTGTEEIISVRVSNDQKRIAISAITEYGTKPNSSVYSLDLKGQDKKEIATSEKAILLVGFNNEKNKTVYSEGCYQCDGPREAYKMVDITTKKATDIIKDLNVKTLHYSVAVSSDMTKFIYSEGTEEPGVTSEGIGNVTVAPYKVNIVDLETLKVTLGDTIGTKDEKNPNGTLKIREFNVGFLAGTNIPYYVEGKVITKIENSKASQMYQADKKILKVIFASPKNIIVATGDQTADYLLSNYSIADSKSVQIFSGDNNTVIFGVTTK